MTADEVRDLALSFPSTEAGTSYGHPSVKAAGKFFTRIRAEDDSVVVYLDSLDQRDMLIEVEPATFHVTDHYLGYPIVLARIGAVDADWLASALEGRWRKLVPKTVSRAWDSARLT